MGVDNSVRVGYGFLLEGLEDALKEAVMVEQAQQNDDLMLFDIVDEFTMQDTFTLVEKLYAENSMESCSVEVVGDYMTGGTYSVIAFLNDYETVSLENRFSEDYGAHLFDDEIPVSKAMERDIEKLKKYFRFLNEEPKPIVAISVS